MFLKPGFIVREELALDDEDLRILENTAIRYETAMNYKTNCELVTAGFINEDEPLVISDLLRIKDETKNGNLGIKAGDVINDVLKKQDKIRRSVDKYVKIIQKNNIKIVSRKDEDYPYIWRMLPGMPPYIFARGDTSILKEITFCGAAGIVGSRNPGRYSLYATEEFSKALSLKGVVIVSGMALGIDRKAHESCLNESGKTVAVIAGGADVIYPYKNKDIYEKISSEGVVITELPPGQEVLRQYFPSRNRLISALSDACLIMEAGMYSGTLHTASFAAAQGKDVFVLPNSIYYENSIGGLLLIRDGAEVLIDADTVYERIVNEIDNRRAALEDFFSDMGKNRTIGMLRKTAKSDPQSLSEDDWKEVVCDEISERPKNIDDLCISLGIPFSYLSSLVTLLEMEGRIANENGKYVLTIRRC